MGHEADKVVVFVDYQNTYMSARRTFFDRNAPATSGQVNPLKLGRYLAQDSQFDRRLKEVRVYRGIPSAKRDPKGYGAARRQIDAWRQLENVVVFDRPLQYPKDWPDCEEKPNEKGIDVALAIDFVMGGIEHEYDVGILMSLDTDLKPPLEVVAAKKRAWGRPRPEVAAFRRPGSEHSPRLSLSGDNLFCHWIDEAAFERIRDDRDYNVKPRR